MSYIPENGFPYYYELAKSDHYLSLFSDQSTIALFNSLTEEMGLLRYSPEKWTIKQVIGHVTDHERIKMSRAFLLSRQESVQLWGYDQNKLVENSRFEALSLQQLVFDFTQVRNASLSFIKTLSSDQLALRGYAGSHEVTLEEFLKSIIGHERHHINVIKVKYLSN